jgi:F-type H+-transporting ATPase subunit gamma
MNLAGKIENISHPLLEVRPEKRVLLIVVTGDRGLCGAFNSNLTKAGQNFLREHAALGQDVRLYCVGRKGRDFFKRRNANIVAEYTNFFTKLNVSNARDISVQLVEMYTKEEVDAVYLLYNEFKSAIQQRVVVEKLLPLGHAELDAGQGRIDYIFEQPPQELFNRLLPRYVEIQVYRALLESAAAEHGARMAAMDTASRNAGEMIESLTLNMNRIRQAAITREIIEVVSGAGAQ